MRLEGVDTQATIEINGNIIGHTESAFHPHQLLIDASYLKRSGNKVTITIVDAITAAKANAKNYPYPVPTSIYYNTWSEPSDRNFLRKSPKDFGWDWGPAFQPSGITGEITISKSVNYGRLNGVVAE